MKMYHTPFIKFIAYQLQVGENLTMFLQNADGAKIQSMDESIVQILNAGENGLKAFEKANKESLANLDIMAIKKLNKGERMQIPINQGDFKTLQTELDKKLIMLKGKEFVNNETGIKAHIATRGIGEIISNVKRSVENGFTFKEHFATAENIEAIFEKAHFIGKSKDIKHNDPNVSIYRFSCPILLELKQANAILTLKEWKENGKRIYALKLEQLEKAKDES